jgi:RNA polymerase sigma factor (sigma-70 family)
MSTPNASKRSTHLASAAPLSSDARLVRRAARRDERAFAAIYRRYHQEIYRFCLALLGNEEDARDALQNTMVKALQALPDEERRIQLRPWLYRVAHNESIEIVRGRGRMAPLDTELADPAAGIAETAAARERLRQLLRDLADLPERQRTALVLRELGGLEFTQIGEFFGSSDAGARQAVYEARVSLRSLEAGREMTCEEVMHRLSNADGRAGRRRDLRAHLRDCPDCRAFRDAIKARRRDFAAIAPLPALASAGILHAALGSAPGAAGGVGGGAAVAAGAGKAVSAGVVAKSVATVAVVAAVGVSAADRSGLIHTGLPGGSGNGTPAGQVESAGAGDADEAEPGSESTAKSTREAHKANRAKHAHKEAQAHRQDGQSTAQSASRHGQETAAAHSNGASSHANGASHGRSHHAHHAPRGHSRAHAKPKHTSKPPPAPVPRKPAHEGPAHQPKPETSPPTEQSSASGGEKAGSSGKSEGIP